jgi:ribonuclease HI
LHKLAGCTLAEQRRSTACPDWILRMGRAAVWDPLFSRAVPAKPKPVGKVVERTWWEAATAKQERIISGEVYTDGASKGPFWKAARAGWAVVVLDREGKWVSTLSGTLGGPHSSAFRAELKAVLEALRLALPPLTIYCDNAAVVQGFDRGKEFCVSSKARGADLWRQVWFMLDEIGGDVRMVKVKAHTTWADVLPRRIRHVDHVGNDLADKAAKRAAQAAEAESPTAGFNGQLRRALVWFRWVLSYVGGMGRRCGPPARTAAEGTG